MKNVTRLVENKIFTNGLYFLTYTGMIDLRGLPSSQAVPISRGIPTSRTRIPRLPPSGHSIHLSASKLQLNLQSFDKFSPLRFHG